jgi:hypothetical protein
MLKLRKAPALLPVLLFGCSHQATVASAPRSAYMKEVQLTHQAGLPVYAADIKKTPPPAEQNAAQLYRTLTPMVKSDPAFQKEDRVLAPLYGRRVPTHEEMEAGRKVLARRKDTFKLIHSAVSRPECDYQRDWAQGPNLRLPEYATMRAGMRWLSSESALLLLDGKPIDAVNNLALGFRIGRHVSNDPIIIAYLVGIATDLITLSGLEKVLYVAGERPGVAEAVSAAIEKSWKPNSLAHAMGGETVMATVSLELLRESSPSEFRKEYGSLEGDKNPRYVPGPARWHPWIDDNGAFMLEATRKATQACELPYPDAHRKAVELDAFVQDGIKKHNMSIADLILPSLSALFPRRAFIQSRMDIVRAAAKLIAWKRDHGSFPDRLEQAVSPVPSDPFDLKPLRYRREGNGFVVYSVGETGKFDGGTVAVKPDAKESLFRYPRPAYFDQEPKPN